MSYVGADTGSVSYKVSIDEGSSFDVERTPKAVRAFLKGLEKGSCIAIEATGRYHCLLCEMAHKAGFTVYVLNPSDFALYRSSRSYRVKTDSVDAQILSRYARLENDRLRPWTPPEEAPKRVRELLGLREQTMQSRIAMEQSLKSRALKLSPVLRKLKAQIEALRELEELLEEEIAQLLIDNRTFRRMLDVPGIGVLGAAMLTWIFSCGKFASADSLVAFVGLDVRIRESGKWRGRSMLTKRGDPLCRKILHQGASSLRTTKKWKPRIAELEARGFKATAITVYISRKMLRLVWALETYDRQYQENYMAAA